MFQYAKGGSWPLSQAIYKTTLKPLKMTKLTKTELKEKLQRTISDNHLAIDCDKCMVALEKCKDGDYVPQTPEEEFLLKWLKKIRVVRRGFVYRMAPGFDDAPPPKEEPEETKKT